MNLRKVFPASLALLALVWQTLPAVAQPANASPQPRELRVITSGGLAAAYDALAPQFEAQSGIALVTAYGASLGGAPDSIPARLERGETFDVIIMSRPALDDLSDAGWVRPHTRTDLARSLIGMAVRSGAAVPDIGTPERFVQTLRAAESIGYSASASGTYLSTELFPRLGLWDELAPKSVRIESERVASVVARGEIEIGFQQVSEILPIAGVQYVGPIPAEYQSVTTFSAGIASRSGRVALAQRLIDFLASSEAAATFAKMGLEPVAAKQ